MLSVREHPKLRLLFKINYISGFWIPKEGERIPRWPSAWEIFMLTFAIFSCCLMMATLLTTIAAFRLSLLGQPLIVSVVYFSSISKAAYWMVNKARIVKLFSKIDAFVRNPALGNTQPIVVKQICDTTSKSLLLQLFLAVSINLAISLYFLTTIRYTYAHVSSNDTILSNEEKINDELFSFEKWKIWNFAAAGINGLWLMICPMSNIAMDCIMYLCHYFIAQETTQLRRIFVKGSMLKGFAPIQRENFDKWVVLFNCLNRYSIVIL
jgi:hypothetical protein